MVETEEAMVFHGTVEEGHTILCFGFHEVPGTIRDDTAAFSVADLARLGTTQKITVIVRTPTDLRLATTLDAQMPAARKIELVIQHMPSWRRIPLPSPANEPLWQYATEISSKREKDQQWRILMRFDRTVPAGPVVSSVSRMLDGHRITGLSLLAGPAGPGAVYNPGCVKSAPLHESALRANLRYLTREDLVKPVLDPHFEEHTADKGVTLRDVTVDERSVNPIGFTRAADGPVGRIAEGRDGLGIDLQDGGRIPLGRSGYVSEIEVSLLRPLCYVYAAPPVDPAQHAALGRALVSLAAAGVPVLIDPSYDWDNCVGPELAELMTGREEPHLRDPLTREIHSVRLRRRALREHSMKSRWRSLMTDRDLPVLAEPLVSVAMCTRRPQMVPFALRQIERQRGVRVELLLGLHGTSRNAPGVERAIATFSQPVTVVEIGEEVPFGQALNEVCSRAAGAYLAKMDDDDWYGPHHLADALLAQQYSGAELVGSRIEFIFLEEIGLTVSQARNIEPELPLSVANELLTGGTFLFTRGIFEAVGGFKPVPRYVDSELLTSIKNAGGGIYQQHGLNYLYRRRASVQHTWQASNDVFLAGNPDRWEGRYFNELMELPVSEPFC